MGSDHPHTLTLVNNLGGFLYVQGRLSEAAPLFRRALEGRESKLGKQHPDSGRRALRDFDSFWPFTMVKEGKSMEIDGNRVAFECFQDTLTTVNNLALLLEAQGSFADAEPLFRRALRGFQQELGSEHPDTLAFMNNRT